MPIPKNVRDFSYYNRHRKIILARRKLEYRARTALTIARAREMLDIPLSVKMPYAFARRLLEQQPGGPTKLDETQTVGQPESILRHTTL